MHQLRKGRIWQTMANMMYIQMTMQELYEAKWPRDSVCVWNGKTKLSKRFLTRSNLEPPVQTAGKDKEWRQTVQTSHLRFEVALVSHPIGSSLLLGPPQAPIQRFFQLPLNDYSSASLDWISVHLLP